KCCLTHSSGVSTRCFFRTSSNMKCLVSFKVILKGYSGRLSATGTNDICVKVTKREQLYLSLGNHMTAADIIKDIKARKFKPVYLLHGEEPYYIDQIIHYMEHHVLNDMEKGFNQTV